MADPTARFTITASDQTAAAFRSADRNLRAFSRTLTGVRSILGGFGIVLSGRAFASWIRGAMDAKEMTEEQLKATQEARAAMLAMREASDQLARSMASLLVPAMREFAELLTGTHAIINDLILGNVSQYDQLLRRLTATTEDLFQAEKRLGELRERGAGHERARTAIANQTAEVARLREELAALEAEVTRVRGVDRGAAGGAGYAQFIQSTLSSARAAGMQEIDIPDQTYRPPPHSDMGGGMDPFMLTPEMREQALEEEREFQERRRELLAKVAEDHKQLAQSVVDEERRLGAERIAIEEQIQFMKTDAAFAAAGFLRALGAEHRGAAIAALAIEKALAVKQILFSGHVAAAKALAIYGPTPQGFAAAKAALLWSRVNAGFVAATGLVEALQISHGGTGGATLGTSANPLVTSSASTTSSAAAARNRQTAVQVHFHGDMLGWDEFIRRRVIDGIRQAVDGRDVVIIGGNSRQAELIRGST
jgi:hypothetical protein